MAISKVQSLKDKKKEIETKGTATNAKTKAKAAPEPEPEEEEEAPEPIILEAPEGPLAGFIGEEEEFELDDIVQITDEDDPLYDPRSTLPLSEGFVASIRDDGQLEAGLVYPMLDEEGNPTGQFVPVAGNQRYKALKHLAGTGIKGLVFKAKRIDPAAGDMGAIMAAVMTNELRVNDSAEARARNMARVCRFNNGNLQATAKLFDVSPETVRQQVKLYENAIPATFKAINDGIISATTAVRISGLEKKEQKEAIDEARKLSKQLGEARVATRHTKKKIASGAPVKVTETQLLAATGAKKKKVGAAFLQELAIHPGTPKQIAVFLTWQFGELSNEEACAHKDLAFLGRNWSKYENAPELEEDGEE